MMLLTVADVLLRGLANRPIRGAFELVELLLAATFFVAVPATFLRQEHILVDTVDRAAPGLAEWLQRLAGLVAVMVVGVMAWQAGISAYDTWSFGDVTPDLSLPRILYWIPVVFGLGSGALAALAVLVRVQARR
jgi:TRAP-type C4-dicarboxylate transport system permease small subunit